jgi:hypothetical protein
VYMVTSAPWVSWGTTHFSLPKKYPKRKDPATRMPAHLFDLLPSAGDFFAGVRKDSGDRRRFASSQTAFF